MDDALFNWLRCVTVTVCVLVCGDLLHARESSNLDVDVSRVALVAENDTPIRLSVPESLQNDQCERRLYGTRAGIIGMFDTLYFEQRRVDSYEAAIRELSLQPESRMDLLSMASARLREAAVGLEEQELVLDLIEQGSLSISKNFVKAGTLTAEVRNKLANVGRKLNAARKSPAFAKVCMALQATEGAAKIGEVVVGAFLLNSLATDAAEQRVREIGDVVRAAVRRGEPIDPALEKALVRAENNIAAARDQVGAFMLSVNDELQEITDSAINLGSVMVDKAAQLSPAAAMWIAAPLWTYNTLRGISDQWELAQDAATIATLTHMIRDERAGGTDSGNLRSMSLYGEYAFYSGMEQALSTGGARFKDLFSVGHVNEDWTDYYRARKRSAYQRANLDGTSETLERLKKSLGYYADRVPVPAEGEGPEAQKRYVRRRLGSGFRPGGRPTAGQDRGVGSFQQRQGRDQMNRARGVSTDWGWLEKLRDEAAELIFEGLQLAGEVYKAYQQGEDPSAYEGKVQVYQEKALDFMGRAHREIDARRDQIATLEGE